jgi:hypothetical protein
VRHAEKKVLPALSPKDKSRILVLTQLTDMVVPLDCMGIEGVREHTSFTFGHIGGFAAHLMADRNLIVDFAKSQLK